MTDDDLHALYAYLMTRAAVSYVAPGNELRFPYNFRLLMAGWNLLFLDTGTFEPDPARDAEWNRGAYLVQGVAHCGACHTPRNAFGAVRDSAAFAGAEAEDWHAPPLGANSSAPVPWTVNTMVNYLIDGWDRRHGVAAGPMLPVVNHLHAVPEADVFAIAAYLVSLQVPPPAGAAQAAIAAAEALEYGNGARPTLGDPALARGEAVFERVCADCHRVDSETVLLALTGSVNAADPRNLLNVLVDGVEPPNGSPDRSMPGFGQSLTDDEIVAVVDFIRYHFTELPAWADTAPQLQAIRERAAL
jgi:mono/diheme cytochrome c family protein